MKKIKYIIFIFVLLFTVSFSSVNLIAKHNYIHAVKDYPDPFSPNNDGIKDVINIKFVSIIKNAFYTIQIIKNNNIIKEIAGEIDKKRKVKEIWDGKDENHNIAEDGKYKYNITVQSKNKPHIK